MATLDGDIGWSQGLQDSLHVVLGNGGQLVDGGKLVCE